MESYANAVPSFSIVCYRRIVLFFSMQLYKDILRFIPKPMSHVIIALIVIGLIEFFIGVVIMFYHYHIKHNLDFDNLYVMAYISSGIMCAAIGLILLAASLFFINIHNRKNEQDIYLLKEKHIKTGGNFIINQMMHLWYIVIGSVILYVGIMFLPL